jgi:hypothetical protein
MMRLTLEPPTTTSTRVRVRRRRAIEPAEAQLAAARADDRAWRGVRYQKFRSRRLAIVRHCQASRQFTHKLDGWVWTLALLTSGMASQYRPLWYIAGLLITAGVGAHLYDIILWKLSMPLMNHMQQKAKRDGYWLKG